MKARPRSVENRIADALNEHFKVMDGVTPVERIPVLGRTGPDLTINELHLVVDVKSRLEIPESIFIPLLYPYRFDGMICVRLSCLDLLWYTEFTPAPLDFSSKIIRGYLDHMEEWTSANIPGGVSCVVLHRPKLPIGNSVVIIYSNSRRRLIEYAERYRLDRPGQ